MQELEALESVQARRRDGERPRLRRAGLHRPHVSDQEVLPDLAASPRSTRRSAPACAAATQALGARAGRRQVGLLDQRHRDGGDVRRADDRLRPGRRDLGAHARRPVPGAATSPWRRGSTPPSRRPTWRVGAMNAPLRPRLPPHLGARRRHAARGARHGAGARGPRPRRASRRACSRAGSASPSSATTRRAPATPSARAATCSGLMTEELDESTSQIAHGETVRETATMIGFLTEVVGIRDDIFLGEGDRYQREVAAALEESHRDGVLMQRPAVINLQSDLDHPTQSLADLLHLAQLFGGLDAAAGEEAGDELGVLPQLRQAALGAAGDHRPDDALRDGGRAGASAGLRPGGRDRGDGAPLRGGERRLVRRRPTRWRRRSRARTWCTPRAGRRWR